MVYGQKVSGFVWECLFVIENQEEIDILYMMWYPVKGE
jgi:hypothetical protein